MWLTNIPRPVILLQKSVGVAFSGTTEIMVGPAEVAVTSVEDSGTGGPAGAWQPCSLGQPPCEALDDQNSGISGEYTMFIGTSSSTNTSKKLGFEGRWPKPTRHAPPSRLDGAPFSITTTEPFPKQVTI